MTWYRHRNVIFLQQKPKHGESKRDKYMVIPIESFQDRLTKKLASFLANQTWGNDDEITSTEINGKNYYEVKLERNKENQAKIELKAVCTNPREDKKTVSRIDIVYVEEFEYTLSTIY